MTPFSGSGLEDFIPFGQEVHPPHGEELQGLVSAAAAAADDDDDDDMI